MRNVSHFRGDRTWVAVVAVIVALLAGFLGARAVFFNTKGLPEQTVIDFLGKPLPVPPGTRPLPSKSLLENHSGINNDLFWDKEIALDVTNATTQEDMDAILTAYVKHFRPLYPSVRPHHVYGGGSLDMQPARDDDPGAGFKFSHDSDGGPWRQVVRCVGDDCTLDIEMELLDFYPSPLDNSRLSRLPVMQLTDPVAGRRVAWVRLYFHARNLQGSGDWPPAK